MTKSDFSSHSSTELIRGVTVTFKQLVDIKQQLLAARAQPKALIKSMHKGNHQLSVYKGKGMEFSESRLYQSGDDMRHIDWRVSARTGQLHTKLFQEERERPVSLCLDLRSAMFFGSKHCFKSYLLSHLSALFAWTAYSNQSYLTAQIMGKDNSYFHPPSKTQNQLLAFFKKVVEFNVFDGEYHLNKSADFALNLKKTRQTASLDSLIYLLSDFSNLDEQSELELRKLAVKNKVICIQITDDLEHRLPSINAQISDGKSSINLRQISKKQLKNYQQCFVNNQQQLIRLCRANNMAYHHMSTSDYTGQFKVKRYE